MNASNEEFVKTHADLQWCLNILERLSQTLDKSDLTEEDITTARWLVKQALKCVRED